MAFVDKLVNVAVKTETDELKLAIGPAETSMFWVNVLLPLAFETVSVTV